MPDRRNPSELVQVAQRVDDSIHTETKLLAGFGRWVIGLLSASALTFIALIWNQTTQMTLLSHRLETLTEIVNEMRAELKVNDTRYFSKSLGDDHESRIRALEFKAKR